MRGFLLGGCLFFCALFARGQEPAVALQWLDGGFAPGGANFQVTFEFSDMKMLPQAQWKPAQRTLSAPSVISEASQWGGTDGVTAQLDLCCLEWPMGLSEITLVAARLRFTNPAAHPFKTTLSVTIAPRGKRLHSLAFDRHAFSSEGDLVLVADTPSRGAILADSPFAARPLTTQDQAHVESVKGECRGEMLFDLTLAPGQTQTLGFLGPVSTPKGVRPDLEFCRSLTVEQLFDQAQKQGSPNK
jgi:hypothetical protein